VTPALVRVTQAGVILVLTVGAIYLAVSGWQALGDRTEAARSAGAARTADPAATQPALAADPPSGLFIGDGFTSGAGGVDEEHSFACLAARELGWVCNNGGQAGTGYLAAGEDGEPYQRRIDGYRRTYAADYVVVSGGTEDEGAPYELRVAAAAQTFDAIGTAYPRARVVVVGPFASGAEVSRDLRRFDAAIADEARRRGWIFVETLDPPWLDDDTDPTPDAHADLAGLLSTALQTQGVVPGQRPYRVQPSRPSREPVTTPTTARGDR
jgi:hypothetical protein